MKLSYLLLLPSALLLIEIAAGGSPPVSMARLDSPEPGVSVPTAGSSEDRKADQPKREKKAPQGEYFDVVLEEYGGDKKLDVIRAIRDATGLGLREAKDLAEKLPSTVKAGVSRKEADALKKTLEGIKSELKPVKVSVRPTARKAPEKERGRPRVSAARDIRWNRSR